jgi:REP-associated tyrosine transposase
MQRLKRDTMNKFNNKYRIPSARLQSWDYSQNAAYFITICTKNREHSFGKIINNKRHLSHLGVIADIFWYEIKNHSENIISEAFIVMPNHVHGILKLKEKIDNAKNIEHEKTLHATSLNNESWV